MIEYPQEAPADDGRGKVVIVPTKIAFRQIEWTNGEININVIVASNTARYVLHFSRLEFIAFATEALKAVDRYIVPKQ